MLPSIVSVEPPLFIVIAFPAVVKLNATLNGKLKVEISGRLIVIAPPRS